MSDEHKLRVAYEKLVGCVKESYIPPIHESWLQNIISKIPENLRLGKEAELSEVLVEVQANFFRSMQKNVLHQSLKVPPIKGLHMEDLTAPVLEPT